MRVLVFSDLQADEGADRLRSDPSIPLQRWRVHRFYDWAAGLARERKIDAVWDLGDTTNNRTALAHPTLQTVARGCAQLTAGTTLALNFKLLGNHEQHLKARDTHVGDLFSPYFHVVEDRGIFNLPNNLSVVCVSFQYDNTELSRWLSTALHRLQNARRRSLILGHFAVLGCRLNSGNVPTESVTLETLAGADLVLLGHVHRRQRLGHNGWYIGSPFQQDFGEANDPQKAVVILDTDTLALEWVATPFPIHRVVHVDELARAAKGNDILRVMVRNSAEAERLYASPHSGTVEAVYAFHGSNGNGDSLLPEIAGSASFDDLTSRYVDSCLLPGVSRGELLTEAATLLQP